MPASNQIPPLPNLTGVAGLDIPLGPAQPLVLLPVRLETRFFLKPPGGGELLVRVYPDKIHVNTHEEKLTDEEVTWGQHFWEQTWKASTDVEAQKVAWRQLADRFGAGRAAWVAKALRPNNPGDAPASPLLETDALLKPINFPTVQTKREAWTQAPLANLLPKRWHVVGFNAGKLTLKASGTPVAKNLAAGPDPSLLGTEGAAGELPIDDGMKWMVDFKIAEAAGMGIRIPLNADQARGFDFLLVAGTGEATTSTSEAKDLAAQLNAHHYTNDLTFLLPGTPTNNTPEAPSGFTSIDPGHEASYQTERAANGFKPGDKSFVDVLATAFGFDKTDAGKLSSIGNAAATELGDARHMNRVLWPATMGYFLSQMMSGAQSPLKPDACDFVRDHFTNYVRAFGPLPSIRVGRQPYGILPVTSLENWKPQTAAEPQRGRELTLQKFLLQLREVWRSKVAQVARVGRTPDNPERDFAEMMSMDGRSANYAIRHFIGREYLDKLGSLFGRGLDQDFWDAKQEELTARAVTPLGVNWKSRLAKGAYSGWTTTLTGPFVQTESLSETSPLQPNYINLLLHEPDFNKIRQENFSQFQPKGLLYSLLRQALMLEYWTAAGELFMWQAQHSSERFIDIDSEVMPAGMPTIWVTMTLAGSEIAAKFGLPLNILTSITTEPFWNFLFKMTTPPADPEIARRIAPLFDFRASFAALENRSSASLERLMAGTLDLCSYRLDAWMTSFATKRLQELRESNNTQTSIGGYSWVLNLRPNAQAPSGLTAGDPLAIPGNPGFTHAPSLGHAATVAVLRSGHLTHSATDPGTNPLNIDLSSERVRLAEWLIDGVRQGQPLGALLGYRFERRLQDALLGDFIPAFREIAPLVARRREPTEAPDTKLSLETIAANNVVDGLALDTKWAQAKKTAIVAFAPNGPVGILLAQAADKLNPARLQANRDRLRAELELLDHSVDAVSDALIAESVHQAVQGNPIRTASTLEAIARGAAPPPELEVARTPRTGTALVHRLVTLFSGEAVLPPAWKSPLIDVRAKAEPHLNAWAAKLLGDPARIRCRIERFDPETAAVLDTKELQLSELNLCPLDFIYASEGSRDAQPSEIEYRLMNAIRLKAGGFASEDMLRINPRRTDGFKAGELSYGEFAELVRTARKLITATRGLNAGELDLAERSQQTPIELGELTERANSARDALVQTATDLKQLVDDPDHASAKSLRDLILRASHFGLAGAVPVALGDRDALLIQASSVSKELAQRVKAVSDLPDALPPETDADQKQKNQEARLHAVFGDAFVVLPKFRAGNATELEQALASSTAIQDNDPLAVVTWFQRAGRVRAGFARFDDALRYAEILNTGEKLNLRVAQLPHEANGRWVGLPLLPNQDLARAGLSLVVQSASDLDVSGMLAGVLIDEWVEVVPNAVETTGVTFQYDQPDAAPPQSILVAVPPDIVRPWNLGSLSQVLLETIDLARVRTVDLETFNDLGHYLPGLYFAVNQERETASIDFATLK